MDMPAEIDGLRFSVKRVVIGKVRKALTSAGASVFLLVATGFLIVSALDVAWKLSAELRTVAFGLTLGLLVLLMGRALRAVHEARIRRLAAASEIEKKNPQLETTLSTALEYADSPKKTDQLSSAEIVGALVRDAARRAEGVDLRSAVAWGRVKALVFAATLILIACIAYWGMFPRLAGTTFMRFFAPWLNTPPPTLTLANVHPGDVEVRKFDDLTLEVDLSGHKIPDSVSVFYRWRAAAGWGEWIQDVMEAKSEKQHTFSFRRLTQDVEYRVAAGDFDSESFKAVVYEEPSVVRLRLELHYPAYTGKQPDLQEDALGPIRAIKGTRAVITATCNNPLSSARIEFLGSKVLMPGTVKEQSAQFDFALVESDRYRIRLTDSRGRENSEAAVFPIDVVEDKLPTVKLTRPGRNLKVTKTAEIPLAVAAEDDFGVTDVGIVYKLKTNDSNRMSLEQFDQIRQKVNSNDTFYLEQLELADTDVITYWAYAYDNDTISGPKEGTSELYFIEIRPYGERYKEAAGGMDLPGMAQKNMVAKLDDIIELQKGVIRDTFSVDRELKSGKPFSRVKDSLQHTSTRESTLARNVDALAARLTMELARFRLTEHLDRVQHLTAAHNEMVVAAYWLAPEAGAANTSSALERESSALHHLYRAKRDLVHLISTAKQNSSAGQKLAQALQQALDMSRREEQQQQQNKTNELKTAADDLDKLLQEQREINKQLREQAAQRLRQMRKQQQQQQPQQAQQQGQQPQQAQQQGQQPQQAQQQGQQPQQGQQSGQEQQQSLAQRQQSAANEARRQYQQLHALSRIDPNAPIEPLKKLEKAHTEMREAERLLGQNAPDEARDRGKKAEDRLRDAKRSLQRELEKSVAQRLAGMADRTNELARQESEIQQETTALAGGAQQKQSDTKSQEQGAAPQEKQQQPTPGSKPAQETPGQEDQKEATQGKTGGDQKKEATDQEKPSQSAEALAERQENVIKEFERLKRDIEEVAPKVGEAAPDLGRKMQEMQDQVRRSPLDENLAKAKHALEQKRPGDALQPEDHARRGLEQLAKDLRDVTEEFRMGDREKLARAIEKATNLSHRQKELNKHYDQARQKPATGQENWDLAKDQEKVRSGTQDLAQETDRIRAVHDSGLAEGLKERLDQAQRDMAQASQHAKERPEVGRALGQRAEKQLEQTADALKDLLSNSINRQLSESLQTAQDARRAQEDTSRRLQEAQQQQSSESQADAKAQARAKSAQSRASAAQSEAAGKTGELVKQLSDLQRQSKKLDKSLSERVGSARERLGKADTLPRMQNAQERIKEGKLDEAKKESESLGKDLKSVEGQLQDVLEDRTALPLRRLKRVQADAQNLAEGIEALKKDLSDKSQPQEAKEKGKPAQESGKDPVDARSRLSELREKASLLEKRLETTDEKFRERVRMANISMEKAEAELAAGQPSRATPGLNSASESVQAVAQGLIQKIERLVAREKKRGETPELPPEEYRELIERYYKALSDAK